MKIALVQPFWSDNEDCKHLNDPWNEDALVGHLKHVDKIAGDVDLVVFPECYPWSGDNVGKRLKKVTLEFMKERMAAVSQATKRTFIAGGLVLEGEDTSNVVMLSMPDCQAVQVYRKRLLWKPLERGITAGFFENDVVFHFGKHGVIPLICSDVFGERERLTEEQETRRRLLVKQTAHLARQNPAAPIVVCAYSRGAGVANWENRLTDLVKQCKETSGPDRHVLYCNFASYDARTFPGGRSRMVSTGSIENRLIGRRPHNTMNPRDECATVPGVCICDLGANPPTQEFKPYHLPR